MKSIFYQSYRLLFSLLFLFSSFPLLFSQMLIQKSGSVVEKRIVKGQSQVLEVIDPRGTLQWQQSADGLSWTDMAGKTEFSITVVVSENLFLRCSILEAHCDSVFSDVVKLIPIVRATIVTLPITNIEMRSATGGGEIVSDGGSPLKQSGICWDINQKPTINDNKTVDGPATGNFSSTLTGLLPGTLYYVRAYAINEVGTSYGEQVTFTTVSELVCNGTFTDSRDGRQYCYTTIRAQTWMTQNLAYLPVVNRPSMDSQTVPYYYIYDYDGTDVDVAKGTDYFATYGVLYNYAAALKACPSGWHLPTDLEWTALTDYLGSSAGGKMKETGFIHWDRVNFGATNESGFTALPGGMRWSDQVFSSLRTFANFWSSTPKTGSVNVMIRVLSYDSATAETISNNPGYGLSVRCIKN